MSEIIAELENLLHGNAYILSKMNNIPCLLAGLACGPADLGSGGWLISECGKARHVNWVTEEFFSTTKCTCEFLVK